MRRSGDDAALAGLVAAILLAGSPPVAAAPAAPPVQLTAEQERARELALLGLDRTRPGADGRDPAAPNAASYDEATANPWPLPDPLVLADGRRVASPRQWWTVRRPQIARAADETLYGRTPRRTPRVAWRLAERRGETLYGVPVVTRVLDGRLDAAAAPAIQVHIRATLVTPRAVLESGRRAPAVLALTWASLPPGLASLPPEPGPDYRRQILERGWSYVIYDPTSVQPDSGAGLTQGVIGLVNRGRPRSLDDWGALRAWAWGASRVLDRLAAEPGINPAKVAIFGHSRYGKAALVAMADDPRFAAGYISSSGAGGAAPYRRHWGEQVENVAAASEFHWMAGNFLRYAADPLTAHDLPVDTDSVIALAAPRPLFFGAGSAPGDAWVDPHGMFMAAAAAGDVYALLGRRPLPAAFPPVETLLDTGDLAWRQHPQGHTPSPNWPYFLDFAARAFAAPRPGRPRVDAGLPLPN